MNHSLKTDFRQKMSLGLRMDHKLLTSLQILQMPVKELEQFLEEKLIVNPLIPLEHLSSRELLFEDLGISLEECARDPLAEKLFWQSLLQNETENFPQFDSFEDLDREAPTLRPMNKISSQKESDFHEIDLYVYLQGTNWKVASYQPYFSLIDNALKAHKNKPSQDHIPFVKELVILHYGLTSRNALLISLGKEIAEKWHSLFESEKMTPLDLIETATKIGRHRTTILRAIKGKNIFTPHGVFPLSTLFSGKRNKRRK